MVWVRNIQVESGHGEVVWDVEHSEGGQGLKGWEKIKERIKVINIF